MDPSKKTGIWALRKDNAVKTEVEIGGQITPNMAGNHQKLVGRYATDSSLNLQRQHSPADILISDLQPPEL